MTTDLFQTVSLGESWTEEICEDAFVLRQYANSQSSEILNTVDKIIQQAPFRRMKTPGGFDMSAELTSCGDFGWTSDHSGYRYSSTDPVNDKPWPELPTLFFNFAQKAADKAGFANFKPDSCMINRYAPKAKMSLHQDRNEKDFSKLAPIVSLSLGVPAIFHFGGLQRTDPTIKVPLIHGDVVIWGGVSRLCFHSIAPIKEDYHPSIGNHRINLTFRKVAS